MNNNDLSDYQRQHHQQHHQQQQQLIYPTNMVIIGVNTLNQQIIEIIDDNNDNQCFEKEGVHLKIIEEPINRIRYRYRSEKGSHGGLNGVNSCPMRKTYPTIKIENYHHTNPVYIRATLSTNELYEPKLHVHKLMGKYCSNDGSCTVPLNHDNMTASFQNLGILFIGKKEVPEILYRRKLQQYQQQQQLYDYNYIEQHIRKKLFKESEKEAKNINLNSVRIKFEAFMLCEQKEKQKNEMIIDNNNNNNRFILKKICLPVYSKPIANQKSPDSGELRIVRLNCFYGSVIGGDEIYLLCEKVNKKEIRIRFYEIDNQGNEKWEAFGEFNENDVHHQVAIVFRTPPYYNFNIKKPINVFLQLYRQRDGESSEPRTFIYKPNINNDNDFINNQNNQTTTTTMKIDENLLQKIKIEHEQCKRRKYGKNYHQQQHKNKEFMTKIKKEDDNSDEFITNQQQQHDNYQISNDDNQMIFTTNNDNYTSNPQHQHQQNQQQQQQQLPPIINQNIDHHSHYTSINQCEINYDEISSHCNYHHHHHHQQQQQQQQHEQHYNNYYTLTSSYDQSQHQQQQQQQNYSNNNENINYSIYWNNQQQQQQHHLQYNYTDSINNNETNHHHHHHQDNIVVNNNNQHIINEQIEYNNSCSSTTSSYYSNYTSSSSSSMSSTSSTSLMSSTSL